MDPWCKTCGRTIHNHRNANHKFESAFEEFAKPEDKGEVMSIVTEVDSVAKKLEETILQDGFVDIDLDMETAEKLFGVGQNIVRMAIKQLEQQGYVAQRYRVQQLGTDNFVTMSVLQTAGFKYRNLFNKVNGINTTEVSAEEGSDSSISELRVGAAEVRFTKKQERKYQVFALKDKGMSNVAIAKELDVSESTVRKILAETTPVVSLEREIASVLNKYSAENGSNTPDFILAEYLMACLKAFDKAHNRAEKWHEGGVLND